MSPRPPMITIFISNLPVVARLGAIGMRKPLRPRPPTEETARTGRWSSTPPRPRPRCAGSRPWITASPNVDPTPGSPFESRSVLPQLRDGDLFRVPRVQHHRDEAGLHLAGVPRHPVQAPGRLVECLACP